jgi:DNA-binding NarL/FixJ family response regulator
MLLAQREAAGADLMVNRPPVTVAIARFEDLVSRGLRTLVEEDPSLELVADDVPHYALATTLARYGPQVALINFGSLARAAEIRELHRELPDTRLLVLANRPSAAESRQLLAFGATACLAKNSETRDVRHAIHLASRGLRVLPPMAVRPEATAGPDLLTAREADVLELLQAGRSNAEIAQALHISVETVRTHARRIYRKLGVSGRRELHTGR